MGLRGLRVCSARLQTAFDLKTIELSKEGRMGRGHRILEASERCVWDPSPWMGRELRGCRGPSAESRPPGNALVAGGSPRVVAGEGGGQNGVGACGGMVRQNRGKGKKIGAIRCHDTPKAGVSAGGGGDTKGIWG